MTRPAVTCHVNDSLDVVAKRMWDHDCGVIVVVRDDGKLGGVVTDRDVCMAAYTQAKPLDQILVNSVMATHVFAAHPDTSVGDLECLMAEHQIRRIPIVDDTNTPVGVISLNDLVIEAVQPASQMRYPFAVAHTLAAICRHRPIDRAA